MKIHRIKLTTASLTVAMLYLAPVSALRADGEANRTRDTRTAVRTDIEGARISPGKLRLAPEGKDDRTLRKIEGQKVRGTGGADLGDVKDLLIEPQSGRVAFAVVASGGLLGVGETLRLVPFASLQRTADGEGFLMNLTEAQWKEMPVIDRRTYNDGNISISAANQRAAERTTPEVATVRNGRTETRAVATATTPERLTPREERVARNTQVEAATARVNSDPSSRRVEAGNLDNVIRASTLRGKEIRSGDQKVGKIENIMLDWESGVATAVLDLDRSFTGTNRKFLIPVSELSVRSEDQDVIVMNLSKADFQEVARMEGTSDARLTPTGRDARTDVRTDVNAPDPRRTVVPDTEVSPALESAVRSARQNIGNHPSLKAAEVEVLAYNGKLLLRGFAESEEMKERVEKAASEGAPGISMESHILVRAPQR